MFESTQIMVLWASCVHISSSHHAAPEWSEQLPYKDVFNILDMLNIINNDWFWYYANLVSLYNMYFR